MADNPRIDIERAKTLLRSRLHARMPAPGDYPTLIAGLTLYRRDKANTIEKCFLKPLIAMICQGAKHILMGDSEYHCTDNDIMIVGVDVPASTTVVQAFPEMPCISMVLDLDKNMLAQLSLEISQQTNDNTAIDGGILTQPVESGILDAFFRMEELLDTPERIPVLAPMIAREIHYHLLIGQNGRQLRSFYSLGSQNNQITRAISWLKQNLAASVAVENLAELVNMAPSTFHRRFKEITGMSPLQFQKRMRLHEAQRLMLADNIDASRASSAVGYDNFSQFSREYKRLFGEPPRKNVMMIRNNISIFHQKK